MRSPIWFSSYQLVYDIPVFDIIIVITNETEKKLTILSIDQYKETEFDIPKTLL